MEDTEDKPFPFFKLPAEIRNMIFRYLLVSCRGCLWVTARWKEPYYYRHTDEGYKDHKDGQRTPINWDFDEELSEEILSEIELISDASRHCLNGPYRAFHKCHVDSMPSEYFTPQLLVVSKQMYYEAGSFFYSNQEFAFETWTDFHLFLEKTDQTHVSKTRHVRLPILLPGIPARDPEYRAGSEDERITTYPVIRPWYGWNSYQDSYSFLLYALPGLSTLTFILPEHLTVLDLTMAKPNETLPKNLVLRMQSLFSRKLDHRDDSSALDRETVELLILQFWKLQGRYDSTEVQEYRGTQAGPRKMERAWDWPFWERSPHWCVDDMLTVDLDKVLGIKKDDDSQAEAAEQSQASEG